MERLWKYLYVGLVNSLAEMSDLPSKLRARLAAETRLGLLPTALETESSDGFTHKYLLALDDDCQLRHQAIEARVGPPGQQPQRIGNEARFGNESQQKTMERRIRRSQRMRVFPMARRNVL